MRATLLHNPNAGRSDHDADELTALLREQGFDVTYSSTKVPEYPDALDEPADLLVIAGGDGTVRKIMTRIVHRETPILILPLGTANNIARSLGIEGEPQMLVSESAIARVQLFRVGMAQGPWGESPFVEAMGLGGLAATMGEKPKLDGEARLEAGRQALCAVLDNATPMQATISIDGRELAGEWLAIEILNNRFTGPGLKLAPNADPGDDCLDVACLRGNRRKDMIDWLRAPGDAQCTVAPPMMSVRGRRIALDVEKGWPLRLDDKECDTSSWKGAARIRAQLQEQPLKLLVPAGAGGK